MHALWHSPTHPYTGDSADKHCRSPADARRRGATRDPSRLPCPFARCKSRPSSRRMCPSCGVISRCADVNFECTQVHCLVLRACARGYGDQDCHEHANVARGHARTGFAVSYIVHKNLHDRYHLPASKEGHLHPKLNDAATHNTNMIRTDRSPEYRCDVMIQHHRRDS